MDEKFQKLKKVVGIVFKQMRRPFVMMLLIISSIIALIAGMIYFISTDDATYKEGDDKNVPYAVEQHTSDVTIDGNGNITTSKTAKELWDEMVKNGSRVNEYLDGPEELLKMMNAEMITNYLDTRKDPTEPIDWKKINRDVNSKTVQGIIKLKRAFDNGKTSIITYTDPATFQMYIDNYNASGSEEDKQKALSHFTLEKGYSNSASFGTGAAITAGTTINIPAGLGSVHTYMGWQCITATSSMQYKLREQAGMNFDSEGFGRINGRYVIACTTTFGQVGDYIDFYQEDGTVIQCIIGDIKNQNDAGCNEWGHLNGTCIIEFVVDKDSWYPSNHSNPGQEGFHMEWNQNLTKAINGGSYFNNPTFGSGTITGNGNTVSGGGTTAVSKWSYSEKSLNNALKHFANENNVAQGICVAGEYIILAQTPHETPRVDIYKLSTGKRVSSQVLNIGHGNSLTYNSRTGEVLSCSGGKVYVMSFDSSKAQLSIKKTITISGEATGAYGITYVSNDGYYYLRKGSYIYKTKDFKTITKAFKYNKTIRTQGLASDGTNIYVMGGDHYDGVIYTYTTSGKLINTYKITNQYEVEELDFYGNKMYISIHGKSNSGGIYYVEGQIGTTTGGNSTGVGNTIGGDLMKWPTDGTNITSYFGLRDAPTAGASTNHGAIDIGVPTGTNVYATEAGTVTTACWSDSAGNMVVIDHGNGYISKYMHNSALKVSAGEKVTKGQIIALAGSTGISTGPHVHFQIEYNGVKIDPLTFKYDNGMGNGTGGIGSNSNSLSTTNTIYAKVATWNEATDIVSSNDPSVENYSTTRYSMSATNVNYQELVKGYKMPFDYLWALLVIGQEKDFIFDLADLVYDSEIEITVHDNLTTNKNVSVDKYTKKTKVITENVNVKVNYSDKTTNYDNWDTEKQHPYETTTNGTATEIGGPFEKESKATYQKTHTIITKTNTLDVNVTKANVWIVDYSQEYTYQTPGAEVTNSSIPYNDEEYPETPSMTDGNDGAGLGENYRQSIQEQYAASHTTATATIESMNSRYYYKTVNRTVNITNTSTSKKYVASPAKIEEKTDRQSKEPNFVTLFLKHRKFQNNIKSATDWLFEVLEKGKNTVDMVDLTKYLLYKATGKDYGVTEFDFNIYNPENFKSLSDQYGGVSNIDGIPGQIYDFLLAKGVPPVGAAAILGNIEGESSFNPSVVNYLGCSGLCQWYQGRLSGLKALANSKGTSWTDVQTQLEYMWSELESSSYASVKNVIMNATQESDMEYATWYWGRYFEVFFLGNNFESTKSYTEKRYGYAKKWYQQWKTNHTGSYSGSAQLGEAARIQGQEARIAWLYDGNGVPTTEAENDRYLETFPVEYLDRNGNRQTMNVKMHRKLKTEVQAIFREMANAGFKVIGGNISYRQWGSDAGFKGRFPQSAHTYGHAFDVNPIQNYCIYANGTVVGDHYSPGSDPYSVTEPIINIWKQHGFYWGGDWTSLKDYMHFSYFNH